MVFGTEAFYGGMGEGNSSISGPLLYITSISILLYYITILYNHTILPYFYWLYQVLIKGVDVDTISRHVIPALVTLASDSHM
jgi:hypothetical protein